MISRFFMVVAFVFSAFIADAQLSVQKTYRAFSLKTAQMLLQQRGPSPLDTNSALFTLAGITKPKAVVLDRSSDDMVLLGECDPSGARLTLDDWATALRARFDYPEADPGVSIDPEEEPSSNSNSRSYRFAESGNQRVRFFAGVKNTAFGQTCFDADWLLKQICFGLETPQGTTVESSWRIRLDEVNQSRPQAKQITARHWYYPVVNDVSVTKDVVLLESFRLGVFSEILFAKVNGAIVSDPRNFSDPGVDDFTKSFNAHFRELEQHYEPIRRLKGLTRLTALAKGISQLPSNNYARFFAHDYLSSQVPTPTNIQVLTVQNDTKTVILSGGVRIKAFAIRSMLADALGEAFAKLVFRSQPNQKSLFWDVSVSVADIAQIEEQQLNTASNQVDGDPNDLFEHSMFLLEKGFTEESRRQLTRLISAFPSFALGYLGRGKLSLDEQNYEPAFADFTSAIELSPASVEAHFLRGVTAFNQKRYSTAVFDFNNALQYRPNDTAIIFNKAIACDNSQRTEEAIAAYKQFLLLVKSNMTFEVSYSKQRIAVLNAASLESKP